MLTLRQIAIATINSIILQLETFTWATGAVGVSYNSRALYHEHATLRGPLQLALEVRVPIVAYSQHSQECESLRGRQDDGCERANLSKRVSLLGR